MKQGRALPEVLTELQRQNIAKHGSIDPAQSFRLEPDGSKFGITQQTTGQREVFDTTDLFCHTTDLFYRQIGSALGIPEKYYDPVEEKMLDLLAENLKAAFGGHDQSRMIRCMDFGEARDVRAMIADHFRCFANQETASVFRGSGGHVGYEL